MEVTIICIFLLLFTPFGNNANNKEPSFSWIDSDHIHVEFDEADEDIVDLHPTQPFGDTFVPCLYEGTLQSEKSGSVTVSGCQDDNIVHIVIYSERLPGRHMYDLRNGSTDEISWVYGARTNEDKEGRRKRDIYEDYIEYEYDDVDYSGGLAEVPPKLVLNVRLGYEESLLAHVGSHELARQYVLRVFTFGKHHFQHFSLGTQILLNAIQPVKFVPDQRWKPRIPSLSKAKAHKEKEHVPITFFCFTDDTNNYMGASYTRRACDILKGIAITKWRSNIQLAAQTYVHENGHLLGAQHDEIEDKRIGGTACTGTGIMTDNIDPNQRPSTWSVCSKLRFQKWFNSAQHDYGDCLTELPEPIITKFHVSSTIQFCYAKTVVESRMKNPGSVAQKVSFSAIIPNSAFISAFVMTINDTMIVATVQEKEEAKDIFDTAVSEGRSAGLVTQDFRDSNLFTINVNIEAGGEIDFHLRYEELLERKLGWYNHIININPGQIVDDLKINVNIDESRPLAKLMVPELKESNEIVFEYGKANKIATVDWEKGRATARIEFAPTREQQMEYEEQKVAGQLLIKYDVERNDKDNEVQVIDGYFVHYFTPENLPTLPKHVIFVLGISGSMVGEKIVQLKDAMFTILNDMKERDYFNIITFSSNSSHWRTEQKENRNFYDPIQATNENRKDAIVYTNRLPADGNTNINDGLLEGLRVAESARINKRLPTNLQSIMVFLSDGAPTEGVTEGHQIRQNVQDANLNLNIPIYSLGFGRDADFNLIRQISAEANAFSKHIYEGSDAAFQLEDFFAQISSPLLSNLSFKYQGRVNLNNSLVKNEKRIIGKYSVSFSQPKLSTFFKGGELVVTGQLLNPEQKNILKVVVKGNGENGTRYKKTIFTCLYPCAAKGESISVEKPEVCHAKCQSQPPPQSNAQKFLRKLHAFLNVKNLLKSKDDSDIKKAKALRTAISNNFVTELTSLVVARSIVTSNTSSLDYLLSNIQPAFIDDYDEPEIVHDGGSCLNPCPANCTGSITMFSKTYLWGENIILEEDTPNLAQVDFDDKLVSLRVEGNCCWNVYPEAGYGGSPVSFENNEWNKGIYKSTTSVRTMFREASSVKLKVGC